ncbi:MAG: glycosyltransferase family 4 protein [Anaerolineae bacterium]
MTARGQPLRVAMLGPYPRDPGRIAGGVEAVVAVLAKEMAGRPAVELHVLSGVTGSRSIEVERRPDMTLYLLPRRRFGRATFHLREVWDFRRLLRQIQPDVVHAHGTGVYAGAAVGCPFPSVITVHGIVYREARVAMGFKDRLGWELDALYERWILGRARHIISISPYVEREFGGWTRAQLHRVENPVPDAYFAIAGEGEPGRILFAGRVIPRKDPVTAIQAFARVRERFPQAVLRIAGETEAEPEYAQRVRTLVAQLGLEGSVHFLGQLDEKSLLKEYTACSVVLLTSVQETAPVVIEQAMAAGRPVVATAVGGVEGLVTHRETGLVAPAGDVEMVAEALIRLLASPAERARMAQEARRQAAQRFKASAVVEQTLAVYQAILAKP